MKALGDSKRAQDDPKWLPFLQKLHNCGYFEGELEGSKKFREKLSTAQDYFVDLRCRGDGAECDEE